jgi:acyl-CoA thioester hydrolase
MEEHTVEIRVRYAETDQMGVVYNSHFLIYFEIGRAEYMRALGHSYREMEAAGNYLAVVEAQCRYTGKAGYDDLLEVTTWVKSVGPVRVHFGHRVRRKQDSCQVAEGDTILACLDGDGRPRRLPQAIYDAMTGSGNRASVPPDS